MISIHDSPQRLIAMNKKEREVLVLEYNRVTVFMEKEKLDAIRRSLHGS